MEYKLEGNGSVGLLFSSNMNIFEMQQICKEDWASLITA